DLKKGADIFEVTHQDVQVGVCDRRYVFGQDPQLATLDPYGSCPTSAQLEPGVARALSDKQAADKVQETNLQQQGVTPVKVIYQDGGQNPSFNGTPMSDVSRPDALSAAPAEITLQDPHKAHVSALMKPTEPQIDYEPASS